MVGRIRNRSTPRTAATAAILAIVLAGCGSFDITEPIASLNRATGTKVARDKAAPFGLVAADDPAAVSVANSVLLQGGSAADAAAALGFSLAVTLPSRASLGGGGVCVIGDPTSRTVSVLDFIPPAASGQKREADRPTAVPTMVRGLTALHARYGKLPWASVLAPAQTFAGDGHIVTKALADDLNELAAPLFADPATRAVLARPDGSVPRPGDRVRQLDVRATLAQIAARGAGEFYNGLLARRLVHAAETAGGTLTAADLRNYLPTWREPVSFRAGESVLHTAPPPAAAGIAALQILQLTLVDDAYLSASADQRVHLQIEAAKRALGDRARWIGAEYGAGVDVSDRLTMAHARQLMSTYAPDRATPADRLIPPGGTVPEADAETSFVVVDGRGLAVACTLTMYHLFGTGRMAPGLGVVLAAAPGEGTRNPLSLGPVLVTRARDNGFRFAFAASGGGTAAMAMANVILRAVLDKEPLERAIAAPRVHHSGNPDAAIIEDAETKERVVSLVSHGHHVNRLPTIGRVNAAICPGGLPAAKPDCAVAADPRGSGLSLVVNLVPER